MQRQLMALGCDGRSTVGFLKLIDANIKADPFRAYLVTELCSASRFLRLRMFPAPGALRRAHGCGEQLYTSPSCHHHSAHAFAKAVHLCCISGATAILHLLLPVLCPPGSSASNVITRIGCGDAAGITPLHGVPHLSLILPHAILTFLCSRLPSRPLLLRCRPPPPTSFKYRRRL
jgi:hypothetical protein